MASQDIQLMAHLMRRAGFGASYEELEARAAKGYEATVEELLSPEDQPDLEMDLLQRYFVDWKEMNALEVNQSYLTYRMINTKRPLQEKMTLFWHGILCTGNSKCEHGRQIQLQLDMFRKHGMGSFANLLLELSQDPAMVFYLDNCMSHKGAINENYGRELLELFSLGVGMDGHANYSEDDVKVCAQAFTGWTIHNAIPRYPYGRYESNFVYNPDDHDDSEKTFLGQTGRWNGEDVIDIIAKQPAVARFIARHLYNFFVADEPQVPAWQTVPPRDMQAIKAMEDEYLRSSYSIRSVLRVLFNSDFFKNARFEKVKSPAEMVVGTLRLVGDFTSPKPGLHPIASVIRYMGQDLMNPPTVEGWHTGQEWIDSGTLVERINFTADQVGNIELPGVQAIIQRIKSEGETISPERLAELCLDMLGGYELPEETLTQLVDHAKKGGELRTGADDFASRVGQMLQLMVATQEYQFA
ncbi:MAG: DUF1800 domain-containing protein [Chloroflexi bacterium]|nr:DUF1800 domain-containing protein [Chloroflexota bacterium]